MARAFGPCLSEHRNGHRACTRAVLESVNFRGNSDGFVCDQELIGQEVAAGFRIGEIAVPTRYFRAASSTGLRFSEHV